MAKATKTLLALALTGAGAYGLWSVGSSLLGDEDAANAPIMNQVWIERMPENRRDMITHLVLVDHKEGRIGVAGKSSQWRHFFELFQYGLEGNRLRTFFPQDKVKAEFKVRSWKCDGDAPHPFELCLEIKRNNRKAIFYSREEWVVEPHDVAGSLDDLTESTPELTGVFENIAIEGASAAIDGESYDEADADALMLD